ncbi:AbrB/MazE/SpoVT family DNA-binding domain-containing protein [Burkholderia glumae]|uniref:AbrB/MazE/SpoVT family DNA-binding domain-containing protein n=1 Tax=Burkholderia glumae TaxID=337 RepID=UPI00358F61F8
MVKGYGERRTLPFVDVDDGCGDKLLELPAELLKALGWTVGDELKLTLEKNGELWLRRAKPPRSRNTR